MKSSDSRPELRRLIAEMSHSHDIIAVMIQKAKKSIKIK